MESTSASLSVPLQGILRGNSRPGENETNVIDDALLVSARTNMFVTDVVRACGSWVFAVSR